MGIEMTRVFEDGLETGDFSKFSEVLSQNGELAIVTPGFRGNYAASFLTNPTLELAFALGSVNVEMTEIYARLYIKIPQGQDLQTNDRYYFIKFLAGATEMAYVGLRREGDAPTRWVLWAFRETYGTHDYGGDFSPTTDWICVELHYSKSLGLYELYVNGILNVSVTVDPATHNPITTVQFGVYKTGATGQPNDPTGEYIIKVLGDEMVIADEYIGLVQPIREGCFIATAAFGSPLTPQLSVLRSFRDHCLPESVVKTYYSVSPPLACFISRHNHIRLVTRHLLSLIVRALRRQ